MRIAPPANSVTNLGETVVWPAVSCASAVSRRSIASRIPRTPESVPEPSITAIAFLPGMKRELWMVGSGSSSRRGAPGTPSLITHHSSLDGLRIDRRADRAGDRQRRPDEHELVDLVLRAVVGEILQVKDLAHSDADHRDDDPVPGLERFRAFVRAHFAAPGVEADRGDFLLVYPLAGLEAQARCIARRVRAPVALVEAVLHVAGAHDHEIAAANLDALRLRAGVELGVADAEAVLEIISAEISGDVEQHAAPDHAVARLVNAVLLGARGIHQPRVVAVPHLVAVEDVAERVPLRAALQRHRDHIVGVTELVGILRAGHGIGAGREHGVDGIEAPAPAGALRA